MPDEVAAIIAALLATGGRHTLSAYDAAYLLLAEPLAAPLATLDITLATACRNAAVTSVLSKHVSALADAGYVRSRKGVRAGRRTTWIALTSAGRKALREHVAALRQLIDVVD